MKILFLDALVFGSVLGSYNYEIHLTAFWVRFWNKHKTFFKFNETFDPKL